MARIKAAAKHDLQSLLDNARALFDEAATLTGEKADELRGKGQVMLEEALLKAQDVQEAAYEKGREVAKRTDTYVHDNPWKAIAISAGVGVLAGWILGRK